MGRGKAFHNKKKGHEPQAPQPPHGSMVEHDINEHEVGAEDLAVVKETYKNSLKKG
ncbi:hypothetical protein [Ectobacillus ponti]|uniref:YfhD family protein n=1 Tax=Ectobacillus ponti TaxID=2961894 RepID=A0AA41X8Z3_9BACI|nr:hypothetical protein [Ectobacillus ponti]MCP8970997.1 hypothetical protein [Ectobacillus ponti]